MLLRNVLVILLLVSSPAGAQSHIPAPLGVVSDFAEKLDPETSRTLEDRILRFRERMGIDLAVVTVPFDYMQGRSIESYSLELARQWQVGRGPEKLGLVLLVAIKPRDTKGRYQGEIRLEVSRNLERDLPDELVLEIVQKMRDDFSAGRIQQALTKTVDEIIVRLSEERAASVQASSFGEANTAGLLVSSDTLALLLLFALAAALIILWRYFRMKENGIGRSSS